ncbi:Ribonuclease BN [Chitinispirillum alkaliphilum]|nr:Ribonuclease BN [Chitinispirillum alkaliphilum]
MLHLLKESFSRFLQDSAPRLAAALSYYTIFSLAPLLIIMVAIVGAVYGEDAAQGLIVEQLGVVIGENAAAYIEMLIVQAAQPGSSLLASIIGVAILIYGASRIFNHLRFSLNSIWNVKVKEELGILHKIKIKGFSLLLVLITGFLLLATIVANTAIVTMVQFLREHLFFGHEIWHVFNFLFLYAITTLIFALVFKFIPSADIDWIPVWVGSLFTALLFSFGRYVLGLYLGFITPGSTYGAAGSLVVILFWIYYSAQILFLGAEFTQVFASHRGTPIKPSKDARTVPSSNHRAGM